MSSLSKKDRVSLCSFTFSDGRRCRTPRAAKHPRFCFSHAQKEARARAAEKLGKDLAYFFSGDYLSACDLSTALSRLISVVVRGDVKPKTARTVAYLAQTLLQAIHISQHEYINAFDTDDWRESIRNSVNSNHDYLFPPARPEQSRRAPEPQQPQPQSQQPGPSSRTPMPPTSAEFVQHVVAGLPRSLRSDPVGQTGQKSSPPAPQPSTTPPQAQQPASTPPSPPPQPAVAPATPVAPTVAHPLRGEAFPSTPPPQPAPPIPASPTPSHAQSNNPPPTGTSTPQPAPNRNTYALQFDHNCRLRIDGKPF